MKHLKGLFVIAAMIIGLTGCKKYDEGPMLSFRSKSERVANTWKAEKVTVNGVDRTSEYSNYQMTFTKDGGYSFSYTYTTTSGSYNLTGEGKWEFQNDEKDIKISGVSNQSSETIHILKLKEKSFWYYSTDGNERTDVQLVPAD